PKNLAVVFAEQNVAPQSNRARKLGQSRNRLKTPLRRAGVADGQAEIRSGDQLIAVDHDSDDAVRRQSVGDREMRPSYSSGRVVNPQSIDESPDEKPRAVGDQTSNSGQASLALLFGFNSAGVSVASGSERDLISRPIDWTALATARGADFDLPEPHAVEF